MLHYRKNLKNRIWCIVTTYPEYMQELDEKKSQHNHIFRHYFAP